MHRIIVFHGCGQLLLFNRRPVEREKFHTHKSIVVSYSYGFFYIDHMALNQNRTVGVRKWHVTLRNSKYLWLYPWCYNTHKPSVIWVPVPGPLDPLLAGNILRATLCCVACGDI